MFRASGHGPSCTRFVAVGASRAQSLIQMTRSSELTRPSEGARTTVGKIMIALIAGSALAGGPIAQAARPVAEGI
jgi:hypothetical protein